MLTAGAPTADGSTTDRYLRMEGEPEVYAASSYTLDQIRVDGSRLIGPDPLKVESAAFDRLAVTVPGREMAVPLQEGRWDGLEDYLQALKAFRVVQVYGLPDRAKPGLAAPYRIELTGKQEQDTRTVACEAPVADDADQIVCINQRNAIPFMVTRATFQSLFERLERLEQPTSESQAIPPPADTETPNETSSPEETP